MDTDLYTTVAQILPVLLLALMWDSEYLSRLRGQQRPSRRRTPAGGYFWTKPRVRAYTLTVTTAVMAGILLCVLVLAGVLHDTPAARATTVGVLVFAMATLLFRIWVDVLDATRPDHPDDPPPSPDP